MDEGDRSAGRLKYASHAVSRRLLPGARSTAVIVAALLVLAALVAPGWGMRIGAILLAAVASAVVARITGFGANLDDGALARAVVLGAVLAVVVAPSLPRFPNPYEGQGAFYDLLVALTRQAVLVAPIWLILRHARGGAIDPAGACLLGFAVGLGFDLAGALAAADSARNFTGIAFLPPFQFHAQRGAVAGYGAWTALAALAIALGRGRPALAIAAVLLVAIDHASVFTTSPSSWLGQAGTLTGRGAVAGPLAWICLAAASVAALRRDEATTDAARLAAAAWRRVRAIGDRWRRGLASVARGNAPSREVAAGVPWMLSPGTQRGLWIAAIVLIFVLPKFAGVSQAFWSLPVLHARLGATALALMDLPLIGLVVGRLLLAAPWPDPHDDADAPAWHAERAILALVMGLTIALIAYPAIAGKPITGIASATWGAAVQPLPPTVLLLLGALATGTALDRARRGLDAPVELRRTAVIRNGATMASALALVAIAQGLYPPLILWLHRVIGPALKPLYFGVYNNHPLAGFAVSNTIAVLAALITGATCAAAAAALRRSVDGAERFFVGDAAGAPGRRLA